LEERGSFPVKPKALTITLVAVISPMLVTAAFSEPASTDHDLDSKWFMDLVVMFATIAIAYFARSTDKAYHKIADVADKLGIISQQQFEIMVAQHEPIIRARIKTNTTTNTQTLTIANEGPPISEISVERAEVYEVTYWRPNPPLKRVEKRLGTIGYYPGSKLTDSGIDTIYETFPAPYLPLIAAVHQSTDREFNGYKTLFNFKCYFRIGYRNQIGSKRAKWFAVDAFGSREITEEEGRAQQQTIRTSSLANQAFVFYQMGIDQFWDLVSRIAPPPELPEHREGFLSILFAKLRAFAARLPLSRIQ
jgi:hypothetical protein